MSDFAFKTIRELSTGLARKAFSPVELLDDVISRCERLEPKLNAFAHTDFEGARKQAQAAEKRLMRGEKLGVLDGIPTSIKDLIAVEGMPQRFGSRSTASTPSVADAPSVARLRAVGAVILGKSTTSEFGCKAVGDSPLTGITRNPWNLDMTPGGSSAGAAAMVAAGLVPYAIGTDGGGSLRIPAALSGLFGIKSQFGRVAVFPTSATPTLAHVGPLTRTVEDAALVLTTIAGFDARDPFSIKAPQPDFVSATRTRRAMRIAWSPTLGYGRVDPEVADLTRQAVEAIAALGFEVEEIDHVMEDPIAMWTAEFYAGVGTRLRDTISEQPDLLDPAVLDVLRAAIAQDMNTYYQTVFERYAFRERLRQFFEKYDLLLTPTIPVAGVPVGRDVPPGFEDKNIVSWATFTYPFNLTGNPAASLPVGFTQSGLPVGLQIVASTYDEVSILSLAASYESSAKMPSNLPPALT
ncbi:amidase [Indioceanicola profundi]|uniref:amidase n=1 Tax=Indioceanicola profundi TaxID=2220096 RepID=UPI000E6AC039|nr:amidase [Indioceanicola profundi]